MENLHEDLLSAIENQSSRNSDKRGELLIENEYYIDKGQAASPVSISVALEQKKKQNSCELQRILAEAVD